MDEQNLSHFRDGIPRLWWTIYQGCLDAGFNQETAFVLLQTFVTAQAAKGAIIPPPPLGPLPPSNKPEI